MFERGSLITDFVDLALLYMKKIAVIGMLTLACNHNNDAVLLNQQLMDLHDDVMKKSSQVLTLKDKLQPIIAASTNATYKDSLQKASYLLHRADQQMLNWMRQYQEPNLNADTAIVFYQTQIAFMKQLSSQTSYSINLAKKLIHE